MATTLKIYRTKITPALNARVDNIDDYLLYKATKEYEDDNFQFVKPQLDMTINIDVSNSNFCKLTERGNASLYPVFGNYLTLDLDTGAANKVDTTKRYYYFVLEAKWISDETVALKCSLDTINTFWDDFHWSPKTSIIREHVNRFAGTSAIGGLGTDMLVNFQVDKASEGIAPARMIKTSDESVSQPNSPVDNWYLMYMTDTSALTNSSYSTVPSTNKLSCYLLPEYTTGIASGTGQSFEYTIFPDIIKSKQYYFTGDTGATIGFHFATNGESIRFRCENTDASWNINNVTLQLGDTVSVAGSTLKCVAIALWAKWIFQDSKDVLAPIGIYTVNGATSNTSFYVGFKYNGSTYFFLSSYLSYEREYFNIELYSRISALSDISSKPSITDWFTVPDWTAGACASPFFHLNYATEETYINANGGIKAIRINSDNVTISDSTAINNLSVVYDNTNTKFGITGFRDLPDSALQDSKIVKIIQLPYCPSNITIQSGTNLMQLSSDFVYGSSTTIFSGFKFEYLKYQSLRQDFKSTLSAKALNYYTTLTATSSEARALLLKDINREPKLLNSDFYTYKLVYDGEYKQIKFEDIVPSFWTSYVPNLIVTFSPTNTIGSSFGFMYNFIYSTYTSEEDFPVLLSSRDNSLPIYNNDYINYMRYTYATDINNLKASQQAKNTSIGLGVAGSAVSTIGGAIGGAIAIGAAAGTSAGPAGTIAGAVVGGIVGAATGIISTINAVQQADTNIANANRSLQSKILNLQNQPVTAQGAGAATDIMTEYSGNKLHVMTYEPDTLIKKAIYDKLFYCGYSHPVQEVPDFTSRFWFNFVQCTPVFTGDTFVFNKYLDDIKARFQIGITVFHKSKLISDWYDWNQKYENWELEKVSGALSTDPGLSGKLTFVETGKYALTMTITKDYRDYNWFYTTLPYPGNWITAYPSNNSYTTTVAVDNQCYIKLVNKYSGEEFLSNVRV